MRGNNLCINKTWRDFQFLGMYNLWFQCFSDYFLHATRKGIHIECISYVYFVEDKVFNLIDKHFLHYNDAMASHITSVSIVCSTVGSGADQRKHQSSASLAFVWGIHRWPINSQRKRPVNVSIWWRHHDLLISDRAITRSDNWETLLQYITRFS